MKDKGITLVAVVITIIVLLILAGIVINISLKENGILQRSEMAKQETQIASNEEESGMKYYESEIQKRANANEEMIMVNKQEYEELKNKVDNLVPKSISEGSILMNSTNGNLNVGILSLKDFTNEFSDNFVQYFSYDETTGEITCQKEGWYCIELGANIRINYSWAGLSVFLFVNNVEICKVSATVETTGWTDNNSNSVSIYLKIGDKLEIEKQTGNTKPLRNEATIKIIKL